MKDALGRLRDKLGKAAAERLEAHRPGSLDELSEIGRNVAEHSAALHQAMNERASDARDLAQRIASDERTQRAAERISAGLASVKKGIASTASAMRESAASERSETSQGPADPDGHLRPKMKAAVEKLRGRDRVGVSAEVLGAAGGVAAGAAAASTVAGVAGATTLFGSSALASALGGIFAVSTPVGWVLGTAVLAGAAGFGLTKLARSGGRQDRIRQEIVERLMRRLDALDRDDLARHPLTELTQLVAVCLAAGHITETQSERLVALVERGSLSVDLAVTRLRGLALANGTIETIAPCIGGSSSSV